MSQSNKQQSSLTGNVPGPRFGGGPKDVKLKQNNDNVKKQKKEDEMDQEEEQDEVDDLNKEAFDNYESKYGPKDKTKTKKKSLDFIFDKQTKELEKIMIDKPYFQDGDPTMYTKENLEKRQALKEDPDVQKAIKQFMTLYTYDSDGRINIESYLFVHTALAELLRDDLEEDVQGEELRFVLQQDWMHDSKGKDYMTKDDLFESLFELVDIWVPEIDKEEYIDFFTYTSNQLAKKGYKNPYNIL